MCAVVVGLEEATLCQPAPQIHCRITKTFTAVVERDAETGTFVGYVPGWLGAHSQGESLEELRTNLAEVVAMLLEDGDPKLEAQFVGTEQLRVA